jgi:hypothetical protein
MPALRLVAEGAEVSSSTTSLADLAADAVLALRRFEAAVDQGDPLKRPARLMAEAICFRAAAEDWPVR